MSCATFATNPWMAGRRAMTRSSSISSTLRHAAGQFARQWKARWKGTRMCTLQRKTWWTPGKRHLLGGGHMIQRGAGSARRSR
jgi:hypothetical protein